MWCHSPLQIVISAFISYKIFIEQSFLFPEILPRLNSQTGEGLIGPLRKSLPIVSMAKTRQKNLAEKHQSVWRLSPVLGVGLLVIEKGTGENAARQVFASFSKAQQQILRKVEGMELSPSGV